MLGNIASRGLDGPMLDHFQRQRLLGGLGAETGAAEDEHGPMYRNGRLHFRNALVGQPCVLLLQQRFELARKLGVVEFTGPITAELAVQSLRQSGQHNVHQLFAHRNLKMVCTAGLRRRTVRNRFERTLLASFPHCRLSRRGKQNRRAVEDRSAASTSEGWEGDNDISSRFSVRRSPQIPGCQKTKKPSRGSGRTGHLGKNCSCFFLSNKVGRGVMRRNVGNGVPFHFVKWQEAASFNTPSSVLLPPQNPSRFP